LSAEAFHPICFCIFCGYKPRTNRSENSSRLFVDAPNTELRKSRGGGGGGREIEDLILESEDRKQMASSTRSIAILAAHRRGGGKENFETYNERTKLKFVVK